MLYRGAPLKGAKVLLFSDVTRMLKDAPALTATTGSDGGYSLTAPPGKYFFIAKKENFYDEKTYDEKTYDEKTYYSYSGRNPITLSGDKEFWVGFRAEKVSPVESSDYEDEFSSAVTGRVLIKDIPVENAYVTVFLDGSDDFKGPGYSIAASDKNGEFFFDYLPESEYFIIARKRGSGEKVGPILNDDLYAYFPGNPLSTVNGKSISITLNSVTKVDDPRVEMSTLPDTGFSGRVLGPDGKPVKGMHVFAYSDPVIGHKRPAALSFNTREDGKYSVELTEGGTYYIGARERHGDSPLPGELFGMYDKTDDHGIKVHADTFVTGIDIYVEKIMLK